MSTHGAPHIPPTQPTQLNARLHALAQRAPRVSGSLFARGGTTGTKDKKGKRAAKLAATAAMAPEPSQGYVLPTWLECQSDSDDDEATTKRKRKLRAECKAAKAAAKLAPPPNEPMPAAPVAPAAVSAARMAASATPAAARAMPRVGRSPRSASLPSARSGGEPQSARVLLNLTTAAPAASADGDVDMEGGADGGARCVVRLAVAPATPPSELSVDVGEVLERTLCRRQSNAPHVHPHCAKSNGTWAPAELLPLTWAPAEVLPLTWAPAEVLPPVRCVAAPSCRARGAGRCAGR